jgi:hypothetical protein
MLPGLRLVVEDEVRSCIWAAEALEVQGEEGDVSAQVAVAELIGELNAVEYAHAVVETEDVLRLEVVVAVADPARTNAIVEHRFVCRQPASDRGTDLPLHRRDENRADEALSLLSKLASQAAFRARFVPASEIAEDRRAPVWKPASTVATSFNQSLTSTPARTMVASL